MRHLTVAFFLVSALVTTAGADILMRPYLQAVTSASIYVMVECTTTDTAVVDFGETSSYGRTASAQVIMATTRRGSYVHKIRLSGLTGGTQYHYRARHGGSTSADATFWTTVPPGVSFRFAWMSDIQAGTEFHDSCAAHILAANPVVSLYGGDLCEWNDYFTFKDNFFRTSELALISRVPFFNATGNHERWAQNTQAFTRGGESASGTEAYYSLDYGDLHVVVMNTELPYDVGTPQYDFVDNDLAASRATWKIVAAHKGAYVSGSHGEDAEMKVITANVLEKRGVQMVISGHNHFYQHNKVNGIHHMTIASAGASELTPTTAWYTIKNHIGRHYAIGDVSRDSLRMTVFDEQGNEVDVVVLTAVTKSVEGNPGERPDECRLEQNYPNPFNPSTKIQFTIANRQLTMVRVFDVMGRVVSTLVNEVKQPGTYTVEFDARLLGGQGPPLAGGVYFYRLTAGEFVATKKLVLVK